MASEVAEIAMPAGIILGEGALSVRVIEAGPHMVLTEYEEEKAALPPDPYRGLFTFIIIINGVLLVSCTQMCKMLPNLRPFLAQWFTERGNSVRILIQKAAIFNIILCAFMFILHQTLPLIQERHQGITDEIQDGITQNNGNNIVDCFNPFVPFWPFALICTSIVLATALRYLAQLLPHTKDISGYIIYSPPPLAQHGNTFTSKFTRVVLASFLLVSAVLGLFFGTIFVINPDVDFSADFTVCSPTITSTNDTYTNWIQNALLVLFIFLPSMTALLMEHFNLCCVYGRTVKTNLPGFYLVVSSPFVITQFVTVWSPWVAAVALNCWIHGNIPLLHSSYWMVIGAIDSASMFVIFLCASYFNKTT